MMDRGTPQTHPDSQWMEDKLRRMLEERDKRIAELEADKASLKEKLKLYLGGWPSLEGKIAELEAKLDARCDHSELLHEIDELTRHNKVLQRADMHREKIWKKRVAERDKRIAELESAYEIALDQLRQDVDRIAELEARIAELEDAALTYAPSVVLRRLGLE